MIIRIAYHNHSCRPAYATPKLLDRAGLEFSDIDVFEYHEAFAVSGCVGVCVCCAVRVILTCCVCVCVWMCAHVRGCGCTRACCARVRVYCLSDSVLCVCVFKFPCLFASM